MSTAHDFRFACGNLRRNPGFTLAVILTLGMGTGATSAIFSLVNGLLLRPLPFPDPDRLVNLWERNTKRNIPKFAVAPANYDDWHRQNDVFSAMGVYQQTTFNLESSESEPERYIGATCDPGFFATLQITPMRGRLFTDEENQPGHDGVLILSYGLWRQRFGGDLAILGKTLLFDGRPRVVLGIMPEGFEYPLRARMWAPLALAPEARARRDLHVLRVVGRIKNGATLEKARNDLDLLGRRLAQEYPNSNKDAEVLVLTVQEDLAGPFRTGLLSILGAVIFVLLIIWATLANLLIAKAASRQREIAIRTSLGASRHTLLRQMFTETMLLSALGGVIAVVVALVILRVLLLVAPRNLPRLDQVRLNWGIVCMTPFVSLIAGMIFGLGPVLRSARGDLVRLQKRGSPEESIRSPLQTMLVVIQMSGALILLTGAALLLRTFYEIQRSDLGFQPERLMTMRLLPASWKYNGHDDLLIEMARSIVREVSAIPNVKTAAINTDTPLLSSSYVSLRFEGRPHARPSEAPPASFLAVSPGYAACMGMRLIRGRFFTEQDSITSIPVIVINQAIAQRYFYNSDPIGQRIALEFTDPVVWREIVGVVADVKSPGLDDSIPAQIYAPYLQSPTQFGFPAPITVLARTVQDPALVATAMKEAILHVESSQPVYDMQPMTETISQSVAQRRFSLVLLTLFAAVALSLAAMGLHGLLSLIVAQSTKEIGIRMALGAQRMHVLFLVQRRGMNLVFVGLIIGVAAEIAVTRLLGSLLFHVSPADPLAFAAAALLLIGVSAFACYLPARRAANVDPLMSLRQE